MIKVEIDDERLGAESSSKFIPFFD